MLYLYVKTGYMRQLDSGLFRTLDDCKFIFIKQFKLLQRRDVIDGGFIYSDVGRHHVAWQCSY